MLSQKKKTIFLRVKDRIEEIWDDEVHAHLEPKRYWTNQIILAIFVGIIIAISFNMVKKFFNLM